MAKALRHVEPLRLGVGVLVGFFVASLGFLALPYPTSMLSFPTLNLWVSVNTNSSGMVIGQKIASQRFEANSRQAIDETNNDNNNKPVCDFSGRKSDVCEIKGDVRIHGNTSSITYKTSSPANESDSWRIRPHPRKGDPNLLIHVREVSIKPSTNYNSSNLCSNRYNVTGIVFSTGLYMGNMFHDFTDILIPLYLTARQFDGEVQFIVSEMKPLWIAKYGPFFKKLSKYEIVDFNRDKRVRCFKHIIVGLRCHKEMTIDPSKSPNGYSMVDFTRFIRQAFSLPREKATRLVPNVTEKPRLLIIARRRTRSFTNVDQIAAMAENLGYEVVVEEAKHSSNLTNFARIVNSCDVMMGVHGAGLTNLVFLPVKATVIQIVPIGRLEKISYEDFGGPALDMKLNYLQYEIIAEESSLIEKYSRDDVVIRDPKSIHRQGWTALRRIYLDNQNVKLDVQRFKFVLLQALQLLRQ